MCRRGIELTTFPSAYRIHSVYCGNDLELFEYFNYIDNMFIKRRITYKLYPSRSQASALNEALRLHQLLYNAALEERIDAWRKARRSVSYVDQAASLTQIRKDDPAYRSLNCHSLQQTLRRLDRAFKAFFARFKKGVAGVGFPRFKALDRYPGWSYDTHGDGFGRSISYVKGRGVPADEGELVAAFTGNHGWFWRNRGDAPVTVVLRTGGQYSEIKRAN